MAAILAICLSGSCFAAGAGAAFPGFRFAAGALEFGSHRLTDVAAELEPGGDFRVRSEGYRDAESGRTAGALAIDGRLDEWAQTAGGYRGNGLIRYRELEAEWSLDTLDSGTSLCLGAPARPLEKLARRIASAAAADWVKGG